MQYENIRKPASLGTLGTARLLVTGAVTHTATEDEASRKCKIVSYSGFFPSTSESL
jgi:hypothetical protein